LNSQLERDANLAWNSFVDLIAIEDYEKLTDIQRTAHLAFWYDAEVCNGGHLQYFANSSGKRAVETVDALVDMKMEEQCAVLEDAIAFALKNPLPELETAEEFVAEALENRFGAFDSRYYNCAKSTNQFLEEYLENHFSDFIELI